MNSMGELTIEQAQYLEKFHPYQNFNPYSQNYNPGWRNHPNFAWKYNFTWSPTEQVTPHLPSQERKSSLDEKMEHLADMQIKMWKSQHRFENETRNSLSNHAAQEFESADESNGFIIQ